MSESERQLQMQLQGYFLRYQVYALPCISLRPRLANFYVYCGQLSSDEVYFSEALAFIRALPSAFSCRLFDCTLKQFELLTLQLLASIQRQKQLFTAASRAVAELGRFASIEASKKLQKTWEILATVRAAWPGFLEQTQAPLRDQLLQLAKALCFACPVVESRPDVYLSPNRRFCGKKTYSVLVAREQDLYLCNFERCFVIEAAGAQSNAQICVVISGVAENRDRDARSK